MAFNIGQSLADIGHALRLPELGLSEKFGVRIPSQIISPVSQAQAAQPGSFGVSGSFAQTPTGGGQAPAGGGAAAPAPATTPALTFEGVQEQAPQQPSINFEALIQPGLQALEQAEAAASAGLASSLKEITSGVESIRAGQQAEVVKRERGLEEQRVRETGRVGEAVTATRGEEKGLIGEARRTAAQIQQGIQARFGGTTGTGKFASEILGAQATKNIAGVRRQAFQVVGGLRTRLAETIRSINTEVQNVRDFAQQSITDAERQAEVLKEKARTVLQQNLADIGAKRGELQTFKAQQQIQAIQTFRAEVQAVNQRNAVFKQQVFTDQQAAEQKLREAQQKKTTQYQTDVKSIALTLDRLDLSIKPEAAAEFIKTGQLLPGTVKEKDEWGEW